MAQRVPPVAERMDARSPCINEFAATIVVTVAPCIALVALLRTGILRLR
jgi:hypothetical protein